MWQLLRFLDLLTLTFSRNFDDWTCLHPETNFNFALKFKYKLYRHSVLEKFNALTF